MGMFDSLHCDYPLGDERVQGHEFQTKDLECLMESYRITEDGRLLYRQREWERVFEPDGVGWFPEEVGHEWVDTNYHGILNFYTHYRDEEKMEHVSVDFYAKFTDGKLVDLNRSDQRYRYEYVESEISDNAVRILGEVEDGV